MENAVTAIELFFERMRHPPFAPLRGNQNAASAPQRYAPRPGVSSRGRSRARVPSSTADRRTIPDAKRMREGFLCGNPLARLASQPSGASVYLIKVVVRDPNLRFRQSVHAAHRAPRARGQGLLRDTSLYFGD